MVKRKEKKERGSQKEEPVFSWHMFVFKPNEEALRDFERSLRKLSLEEQKWIREYLFQKVV